MLLPGQFRAFNHARLRGSTAELVAVRSPAHTTGWSAFHPKQVCPSAPTCHAVPHRPGSRPHRPRMILKLPGDQPPASAACVLSHESLARVASSALSRRLLGGVKANPSRCKPVQHNCFGSTHCRTAPRQTVCTTANRRTTFQCQLARSYAARRRAVPAPLPSTSPDCAWSMIGGEPPVCSNIRASRPSLSRRPTPMGRYGVGIPFQKLRRGRKCRQALRHFQEGVPPDSCSQGGRSWAPKSFADAVLDMHLPPFQTPVYLQDAVHQPLPTPDRC